VTILEQYFYLLANAHSEYQDVEGWDESDKVNLNRVRQYNKDLVSREISSGYLIDFIVEFECEIKKELRALEGS
jgi:hypothetical protein